MENKYYTPDIEDLYVGYECEIKTNHGYESFNDNIEIWKPVKLELKDKTGAYLNILKDTLIGLDDGYQPIRTPYLTKEQIEAEGFPFQKTNRLTNWFFINTWNLPDEKIQDFYRYKAYSVTILQMPDNQLKIYFDFSGGNPEDSCMFEGECKSINEFRKILKMLKIK